MSTEPQSDTKYNQRVKLAIITGACVIIAGIIGGIMSRCGDNPTVYNDFSSPVTMDSPIGDVVVGVNKGTIIHNQATVDSVCGEKKQRIQYLLSRLEPIVPDLSYRKKEDRRIAWVVDKLRVMVRYECIQLYQNNIEVDNIIAEASLKIKK